MSVPDDPFTPATSSGTPSRPPTLTVTTPAPALTTSSGTKTPRRVQWTSDSHIVSMEPPGSPSSPLDEAGLEKLRSALERHKSGTSSMRARHGNLEETSSQGHDGEEDYDYRLDTDPYPQPDQDGNRHSYDDGSGNGEHDPLRSYPPRFVHPTAQGHAAEPPGMDAGLGTANPLPENDIHNQMAVFVDPNETDGMPTLLPPGGEAAENSAQASALVRAHTSGRFGGFLRNRKNNIKAVSGAIGLTKPRTENEKKMDAFAKRYPGNVPEGVNAAAGRAVGLGKGIGAPGALAGGGVLASLLSLYDNGQNGQSGASTPSGSRPPSAADSDSSEEEREREEERKRKRKHDEKKKGWVHLGGYGQGLIKPKSRHPHQTEEHPARPPSTAVSNYSDTPEMTSPVASPTERMFGEQSRSKSQGSLPSLGRNGRESPQFFKNVKKVVDKFGLDVESRHDRPKAARSGAGVMGALMQSTGNITGVAAPHLSTVAPAAKRSGYKLSRFQIGEPLDPDVRKSWMSDASEPLSRPTSMYENMQRVGSRLSNDGQPAADVSPSSGKTQVEEPVGHQIEQGNGKLNRPHKPFSLKNLGSMTHLPAAAGGVKHAGQWMMGHRSNPSSPALSEFNEKGGDYFADKMSRTSTEKISRSSTMMTEDERKRKEWEQEKKKRKKAKEKKKEQEIFIIQHVAAILARQQFILKLARAFMMFGSPSHRLEAQLQATAHVLEINCQAVYFPGTCLVSFGDEATHTSETKFLKQSTGLDLGRLLATHQLYWDVVHDKISVDDASRQIDLLMTGKPIYSFWPNLFIGGMCSAFICCISFYGSFVDALISIPLGVLLIGIQQAAAKNDLYSNVFEITVATINSFLAAALASTNKFCFTAVVSASIVLILPGYIVLCGALELASRNITSGSVRIAYAILYSLQLGFGLSIGVTLYTKITGLEVLNAADYTCSNTHYAGAPWYMQKPSEYWYFLIAPGYSFWLSLRQGQPLMAKETPAMILIACAGWTCNHFSAKAFPNRSDITSMCGSFIVGLLGNIWGKFFQGNSFVVMLVGILFQLPSGLANGGILTFASSTTNDTETTYADGFGAASSLVSVSIGLTVGLFVAAVVANPFGGGRRRGTGIFSF